MTVLEFWGCTLITFGPALAMFQQTVSHDPIKIIVLISSSFFWLLSFLMVAICWALIRQFCDILLVGAYLAVLSQELFRYLFHIVTKRAQVFLDKLMAADLKNTQQQESQRNHNDNANDQTDHDNYQRLNGRRRKSSIKVTGPSTNEQITQTGQSNIPTRGLLSDTMGLSYVSGLGFGLINAAFSMMNVLSDHIGPGTVGFNGDSHYFILVSSLSALAFLLLNISWSVVMSAAIEKHDRRLLIYVVASHLLATTMVSLCPLLINWRRSVIELYN